MRDGRGLGRASWLAGARHSAPPHPTSLGTFLLGGKKVPLRRNRTENHMKRNSMAICPLSQKSKIFASSPVAVPGIFVAFEKASSSADRCHCDSLRAGFAGCSLAWRLRAHIARLAASAPGGARLAPPEGEPFPNLLYSAKRPDAISHPVFSLISVPTA